MIRSGRLGVHVFIDLRDEDERVQLFALYAGSRPTDGALDLRRAARLSRERSPADIPAYVEDAAGLAMVADRAVLTDFDLVGALRRASNVMPDRNDSPGRWRTAVHEAGHVAGIVIASRLADPATRRGAERSAAGGAKWVYAVSLDNDGGGRTSYGQEGLAAGELPDDENRDALVVSFCGVLAEAAMLGEPSLMGLHDVGEATARAIQRLDAGFESGHPPVALDQVRAERSQEPQGQSWDWGRWNASQCACDGAAHRRDQHRSHHDLC